jgi:hypothetical protein
MGLNGFARNDVACLHAVHAHLAPDFRENGVTSRPQFDTSAGYRMTGNRSYWWKGGGDDSVHSNVVAPSPQGLLPMISAIPAVP